MRKKVLFVLIGMILFVISCNKIESESHDEYLNLYTFDVSVVSGTLSFNTVEDYDAAIQFIGEDELNIGTFDDLAGFNSFLAVNNPDFIENNCDEIFASILSKNAEVIIEGKLFSFDFNSKSINVTNADQIASQKSVEIKVYGFDDDVNAIVFENDQTESLKKGIDGYCSSNNPGSVTKYTRWGSVELRMRYLKLGIYYSLTAKIHKTFPDNAYLKVTTWNQYCCWKNKKESGTNGMSDDCTGTFENSAKIKPYHKRFRLKKYYFGVEYECRECKNCGSEYFWDQEISCACSDCSWVD